ncbi:hypothetical protein FOLKNPGA_01240 [Legionella sp. PC1000]|uniref:RNA-directed DNA polymerase n=1 Tax=Legionella sp. PC1000 TaxID=2746060 RepID=UPI0015FD0D39|nr:RNA-directed DNA polymerase [Legionella sp. PC1000]QLZ68461.1 hypothetical protein FOLKNPGA_01240 [Legionella sp. PC1000]
MGYCAKFKGWDAVTLSDLIIAYRKAKADCFFENIFSSGIKFSEYERDLLANLNKLLEKLRTNEGFMNDSFLLGECRIIPKKLIIAPKESNNGHAHFSDPIRAFKTLKEQNNITLEFRVIGDFPVDTHIISALWINMIGHKFDACLDASSYGSRLRRVRNEKILDKNASKPFHITAIGSFEPYFVPYQKWRKNGLQAIRWELEKEHKVIAVSLDLKNYYHYIDPTFLASSEFQKDIGLNIESYNKELDNDFTNQICELLKNWSSKASKYMKEFLGENEANEITGGLAIGLTASRIISNVLLRKWDKLILEKITPIYYGRYIDDMFLVLRDPGTINDTHELMEYLQERIGKDCLSCNDKNWRIMFGDDYQKNSIFQLQEKKQKLFILDGQAGCDLLDSIEKEIYELSSERRLMPMPDQLEQSTAARVLSAAGDSAEQADTLRRADGLTIRRLSWSLQMRHVEILARDLSPDSWKKERHEFYQFAHNHILRADKIFDHYIYLPRLLGFAINLNEWEQAEIIVNRSFDSIERLAEISDSNKLVINGNLCNNIKAELWENVKHSLALQFIEAVAKYYDLNILFKYKKSKNMSRIEETFLTNLREKFHYPEYSINSNADFYNIIPLIAISDLNKIPYKLLKDNKKLLKEINFENEEELFNEFENTGLLEIKFLKEFLTCSQMLSIKKNRSIKNIFKPFLFPTRPFTPKEIAELVPKCIQTESSTNILPSMIWAKYVRVLSGVWVKQSLLVNDIESSNEQKEKNIKQKYRKINVGSEKKKSVIIAITSLLTEDECWENAASSKPTLTLERYKRISKLVNEAIHLKPKPDYLIFPELSLPIKWISSIGNRLTSSGISLIAGTEYRPIRNNKICSQACLDLTDDTLGYPSSIRIWQQKNYPAANEEKVLLSKFGKIWQPTSSNSKPIYNHNNFHFGVMVCSELQNSKERISFQGEIDALMVLSWNKDLETFSSLIESAALDIHAYLIMVNNRKYGDSRVRVPAKESFLRDIARLRGSENDFLVTVEIDINKLRTFQSRVKRWPEEDDPYKPVPEGFNISKSREKLPPK